MTAALFASADYVVIAMSSPLQYKEILEETMISDNNEPEDTHYEVFEKELLPPSTGSAEIFRNFFNLFTIQHK